MKYTIKDIAQLAQVGKSTVSRVINNDPNVSPTTREKVQAIIDALGFSPNRSARAMRGAVENVVGIIVTRLNSSAESQTLSAILSELYRQNIIPLIVESQFQVELVRRHFTLFQQKQVDGIILFGFSNLSAQVLGEWQGKLVTIARRYPHICSVYYDDSNAVNYLMQHFYRQNHRHIAYLGISDQDETTGRLRNQSYLDFCRTYRLTPNFVQTELGAENGYRQVRTLFEQPVSALICASSSLAIGAVKYLQESGRNCPLACIGRNEFLQYVVPELISLDFGYSQAGKTAVELLQKQLTGESEIEHHCIPFQQIG